jgi:hypothetical protein
MCPTQKYRLAKGLSERVNDDDDVYVNKLQTRGIKKSILYT